MRIVSNRKQDFYYSPDEKNSIGLKSDLRNVLKYSTAQLKMRPRINFGESSFNINKIGIEQLHFWLNKQFNPNCDIYNAKRATCFDVFRDFSVLFSEGGSIGGFVLGWLWLSFRVSSLSIPFCFVKSSVPRVTTGSIRYKMKELL